MSIATALRKYGMAIAGVLLVAWSFSDPLFRDHENFLSARICLPLVLAIAAFILAGSAGSAWKNTAAWLALLLSGQAAALQLVQSTRSVGYQHYKTAGNMTAAFDTFSLLLLALQAAMVIYSVLPAWPKIATWLRTNFRTWQLALLGALMIASSAAPSLNLTDYGMELLLATAIQLVGLLTVVLLVRSIPAGSVATFTDKLRSGTGISVTKDVAEPGGIDRFALLAALAVMLAAITLNLLSYEQHPHIPDEVIYLLHAGYLANGMLALPTPPVAEAFDISLMINDSGRWFSAFPPGWPAMLSIGSLLGATWLVNPVLAALCVLLTYLLARELGSRGTARLVVLLVCFSPWFIFLAMSYMAHIFTLFCVLVAACAVAIMRRKGGAGWALLAGIMIGITSLIRPLDGLALAMLLGLWALGMKSWRDRLIGIPLLVIASIIVGAIVLPYNQALTGDPFNFPVMAYFDKYYGAGVNALGFGPDRGLDWSGLDPFPGHGLRDVILNSQVNIFSISLELFGWVSGSLLLVYVLLVKGALGKTDYWMLLVILVVTGLHSLYWFSGGPDFGARYWFLVFIPCIVLTVRGIRYLGTLLPNQPHGSTQIIIGVLALCVSAMTNFLPWRSVDKYFHYNNMRPDVRQLAQAHDFSNSLVLINGSRFRDYMSASTYNDVVLQQGTTIYAWDRDPETRRHLLEAYPDRSFWLLNGPSLTGAGFQLVAGPLGSDELATMEFSDGGVLTHGQ